ncbi:Sugar kinase of the NBD/HSP70 family, may contain an N-terminal HTH domain [Ruminococcus sp. YE71]|uniref:ROK family transcriptional regulator n=1 Tax=unclassified Ruminococcus TaxID=2608920 RepID=UPI000891815F|nr:MULTISPECIES: ROK family transcriptional regulator [unclassified Ruminococcus]SDA09944.1 Sugar kinase of the NBD/HSP70 family, may contain an N-terminal HTH domain [Ruminococcus sp. YE78]SFW11221.1 Sugar kinase of the NBD/HSP70 family, may contain an N-terminal HTH domain [Ruminococcus sp. YE71]
MEQHGISKLDLKRRNRMQVLKILKQRGPTSRIDIASALELTRAAVTIITNEMIDQGIISEIGEYKHISEKAPRGRKKILIDINHHYKFALGMTVEEELVSIGLSTLSGDVLDKRNLKITDATDRKTIYNFFIKSMNDVLSDNCLDQSSLLGIGFAIYPTMFQKMDVTIEHGQADFSQLEHFMSSYTSLPMVFDNSVKGTAMANIDFLKDRDPSSINIAFLQYGRSLNFVFTNLNEPIRSYDNRTDFVNKMIINPTSERICDCGRRGCVENELTTTAIKRRIVRVFSKDQTPFLYQAAKGLPENITMEMVLTAYSKRDPAVVKIVDSFLLMMAVLINNLYFSTNPQKIVLHKFPFSNEVSYEKLKETVMRIGGERVANAVSLSFVEDKHHFLSGCALAIRELFYNCGGYSTDATENLHHDLSK